MDEKSTILKYVLQNAIKYDGKASHGAIIGKLFAEDPSLKEKAKELGKQIAETVKNVNKLSVEEQTRQLLELAPELLEKKEKKKRNIFEFLKIPEGAKIKTAFPPGPEKYPHLGHAKAALLNYLLAKQYGGEFTLRFEDTNPELVKSVFYDVIVDNLKWLGITWEELFYASDYMKQFYTYAEELIKKNKAYICFCTQEISKDKRMKGEECACRNHSVDENLKAWKEMHKQKEGACVLRLKIDMQHKNSTMRDPASFRIIDAEHARLGKKYRVWPTYDFQNSVMDGICKITHRIRSKEFEMRSELQKFIQNNVGLPETQTYEMARFNLKGVPSSGRIIREMIEKKELIGWDDPSLTTLVALRRRGFTPDGIKDFLLNTGITKSESTLEWDDLIVSNRRIIDKEACRFFFIGKPHKIHIELAPSQKIALKLHPDSDKKERLFSVHHEFYIEEDDFGKFAEKKLYRLMDCLNFFKKGNKLEFDSLEYEKYKEKGEKIIHWLPADESVVNAEVLMPDKAVMKGFAEGTIQRLKIGDLVQFERFGFCRLDSIDSGVYKFWFTHE
jgi:glutamyl-tRNA synthetase